MTFLFVLSKLLYLYDQLSQETTDCNSDLAHSVRGEKIGKETSGNEIADEIVNSLW